MSIPVLGVPVLNRPDLLVKMLASIDEQVERLVIIDNSAEGNLAADIEWPGKVVVTPHANLGCSASWNFIIQSNPLAPWWALVNNDIVFAPGDLKRLVDHMESQGGVGMLLTPSAFGISRDAIGQAGWFDENFHPAYYEDNDYVYRCGLTGVTVSALPAGYAHERSATIHSENRWAQENGRTFPQNHHYYVQKWGGVPLQEEFKTPFNAGGSPRDWSLELSRLSNLTWKKE